MGQVGHLGQLGQAGHLGQLGQGDNLTLLTLLTAPCKKAMSGAEKQRKHRARVKAGRKTYTAELSVKATDELVYDAGLETFGELCQLLLKLDARLRCVTVDRRGLAGVVLSLAEELRLTEDKTP